jgi:hypothetical protein
MSLAFFSVLSTFFFFAFVSSVVVSLVSKPLSTTFVFSFVVVFVVVVVAAALVVVVFVVVAAALVVVLDLVVVLAADVPDVPSDSDSAAVSFVFAVATATLASSLSICFSLTFVPEKLFNSVSWAAAGVTVADAIIVAIINALLTHTKVINTVINTLMLFFDVSNFFLILFSSRIIRFKILPGNETATVLGSRRTVAALKQNELHLSIDD